MNDKIPSQSHFQADYGVGTLCPGVSVPSGLYICEKLLWGNWSNSSSLSLLPGQLPERRCRSTASINTHSTVKVQRPLTLFIVFLLSSPNRDGCQSAGGQADSSIESCWFDSEPGDFRCKSVQTGSKE